MAQRRKKAGATNRNGQQPRHHAPGIREKRADRLAPDMAEYFTVCEEHLGFVPNILRAYRFHPVKSRAFVDFCNELMLMDSGLSKLERGVIAVVVSSIDHCVYCLTAPGWPVSGRIRPGSTRVITPVKLASS